MFYGKRKAQQRSEWLDRACYQLKHSVGAATRLFKEMVAFGDGNALSKEKREVLDSAITDFVHNKERMNYAQCKERLTHWFRCDGSGL